jgi:hypothetical protein
VSAPVLNQASGNAGRLAVWLRAGSGGLAAGDDEGGAGGEGGVVRAQPQHGGGDLLGLAEAVERVKPMTPCLAAA